MEPALPCPKRAYVYAICVDGVVRYIGKGQRRRFLDHAKRADEINRRRATGERVNASLLYNRMAKAMRAGAVISYVILHDDLDPQEALDREITEIEKYPVDAIWNTRREREGYTSPGMKRAWKKPGRKEANGARIKALWENPEARARMVAGTSAGMKDVWRREGYRDRHVEIGKDKWTDPAKREIMMAGVAKRPIDREALSAKARASWQGEAREKQMATRRTTEHKKRHRDGIMASITDEKRAAFGDRVAASWKDPEMRAQRIRTLRATQAAANADKLPRQVLDFIADNPGKSTGDINRQFGIKRGGGIVFDLKNQGLLYTIVWDGVDRGKHYSLV